ncbi:MAG: glycosyltransferase family 2 protein [Lachnospiraceae bacterium]
MKFKVDVIIPTYKPDQKYVRLLQMLQKQSYPIQKIIVMNTEKDFYRSKLYPEIENLEVHHIKFADFNHGGTRNQAVRMSNADIVVCMTQDAIPKDQYLIENLIKAFENEKVAAAYARQLPAEDCNDIERYTRQFNYPEKSRIKTKKDLPVLGVKTYFCSNVCAAYRRDIYEAQGGFPVDTIFNEDMIFAGFLIQKGYAVAYMADAKVVHSHNYSGIQQLKRNFDLAVSQKQFGEIFDGIKSESEGIKLVKNTASWLKSQKKYIKIFYLVYISGCKYIGYLLGKHYKSLPKALILKLTANRAFWKNK